MVGEGTAAIFITFLLAIIGYVGLTALVVFTVRGRHPIVLWRIVVLIIFIHVLMVWFHRYGWNFDLAVRNGYVGFVIFHTAFVFILTSTFVSRNWAHRLVHISFLIVTVGAIGASFRYEVVSLYRYIVIPCGLIGTIGLFKFYVLDRKK